MSRTAQAWRDPIFRATLSDAELAELGPNPVGMAELTDHTLNTVVGGASTEILATLGCCGGFTQRTCITCSFFCGDSFSCVIC